MGKAMLRMALVFAQLEREQTSERVLDVMTYRATLGQYNGGTVPFGYICANKTLEISKAKQPIIELIFSLFLKSFSTTAVSNHLNDAKIPSPSSAIWTETSIEGILKNPIYKGHIRWKNVIYPAQHQPIIAPSIWDTVQQVFESKRLQNVRTKTHALLQKLAHCGLCNTPLVPSFAYNRSKTKYTYYRCGSTLHGKHRRTSFKCTFKYIASNELHTNVQTALHHVSSQIYLSTLDATVDTHNIEHKEAMHRISQHMTLAEDELKRIKAKKNEYVDILVTKTFSTQDNHRIHDRMAELDKEQRHIQAQQATYHLEYTKHKDSILSTDQLKREILHLFTLSEHENPAEYRAYLHTILEKVIVTTDSLTLIFKSLPLPLEIPLNTS
jgi:hypothetical protein